MQSIFNSYCVRGVHRALVAEFFFSTGQSSWADVQADVTRGLCSQWSSSSLEPSEKERKVLCCSFKNKPPPSTTTLDEKISPHSTSLLPIDKFSYLGHSLFKQGFFENSFFFPLVFFLNSQAFTVSPLL